MIVVDNDQPKTDFLEWARPTLEQATMTGVIRRITSDSFDLEFEKGRPLQTFRLGPKTLQGMQPGLFRESQSVTVVWKPDGDQKLATNILANNVAIPSLLDDLTVRVMTEPIELTPEKPEVTHKYLLYNGPVKVLLLGYLKPEDRVNPELVHRYETTLHLNTL